jgi:hypothetical protein
MRNSQTLVRRMYAASSSTTNDLAHIDLPFACLLVAIDISIQPTVWANSDAVTAELSVSSVGAPITNDAQGILANCAYSYQFTTSGGAQTGVNKTINGIAILLPAGTRVYLHSLQNGTSATRITINLHLLPV